MESAEPLHPSNLSLATAQTSDSDSECSSLLSQELGGQTYTDESRCSLSDEPSSPGPGCDEVDGDDDDPIVVCGFAVRFPGDASSSEEFWKMMLEKRCASGEFPSERVNIDGFYQKDSSRSNTLPLRGGHFIKEDTAKFDADFFSISPTEAASLDPMQRWLLEVTYSALENAGIPMESISGTPTGVFTGAFGIDYLIQLCRDVEDPPPYAALGLGISMLANRLSWFFNLRGPSVGMDSACSSTAMALDHACQSLKTGACSTAILAGSNLAVAPETYTWLSNINFLSPSSRCYSFDYRANGYARGEGIGAVILKKLSDAIRDGNTIRAVIRATGSNEDGKTPSITQPSREAQEDLIHDSYRRAGLSMAYTRFFESHGTGTAVGDPREAQAIGSCFRKYRSIRDPLYVGALKSNIGHLEGAAALAGLVKAIMVLEKGVIPPNTNFEKVNPKIDARFLRIKFPQKARPWPTSGLRRASVNSFGYGGSNSHIVLDDAYNYLRLRGLNGKHRTAIMPPDETSLVSWAPTPCLSANDAAAEPDTAAAATLPPKLILLSSADKSGIGRIAESLQTWYTATLGSRTLEDGNCLLDDLAYTLDSHRSQLPWQSFALLESSESLKSLATQMSTPARVSAETPPRLGFVFSGQGAQWFAMGRELLCYSSFKDEIREGGRFLADLGCPWSPLGELSRPQDSSNVDKAEYSQALCTILQVAIVNLLRRFGIRPSAVVGHSSGEIAAAYAAGHLSQESAWKVAYFRGVCSATLAEPDASGAAPLSNPGVVRGTMMSIGLSESETRDRLAQFNHHAKSFGLTVACINSPCNVTVSGEEELIDILKSHLDGDKVFARKLRVPLAYHSGQMQTISEKYASLMGSLSKPENSSGGDPVPMLSSVTGNAVSGSSLVDPAYWVRNMVSPVRFSQAVSAMCSASPATITKKLDMSHLLVPVVDQLLEIGPHAVLQGPLRDILGSLPERTKRPAITYSSALRRGQKATDTLLGTIGSLFCKGVPVDLRTVNEPNTKGPIHQLPSRTLLTNLPEYPFDHSRRYWHESRLSRNYTLRSEPPSELVGVTSRDSKIKWRHFLRRSESPWIEHHVVNGKVVYPAAGMLAMGIEAARQIVAGTPGMIARGYTLRDVRFENPLDLSVNPNVLEVQTSLTPISAASASNNTGPMFDFIIESFGESDEPRVNCRGVVSVEVPSGTSTWSETMAEEERRRMACELLEAVKACDMAVDSKHMYDFLEASGYGYGRTFQRSREQRCSRHHPKRAAARISMFSSSPQPHIIHPATLDAVVQLCFTCLSSGGQEPMATGIPSRLGSMWVAASGLSLPAPPEETDTLTGVVSLTKATSRTHLYSGAMLGNGHNETTPPDVMLWYDDLEMTDISSAVSPRTASSKPDQQFCMTISTQVAIDKLTSQEKCDLLQSMHPEAEDVSQLHRDLEVLAALSLDEMTSTVDTRHINDRGDWARRYWNWAEYHLSRFRRDPAWDDPESVFGKARRSLPELRERLSSTSSGIGKAYAAVSLNLHRMLEGKIAPLELLMPSGLLDGFYAEGNTYRSGTLASSYLSLVAHQKPDLRIIEVGGGTASTTKIMVPALSDSASGSLRCARYDFTDISPGFLENAREAFTKYQSKMTFGTLNVENDPVPQGYEEAAYDVVIADNVLHATLDLSKTLRNVRKLLKPGGKVFLHEWFRADGWSTGFIFGLLSGWWLGADTGREMSPNVSVEEWDSLLKEAGFTGVDEVLRDFDEDGSYDQAYLVATAAPIPADRDPKTSVTLVVGPSAVSETQDKLIKSISGPLTAQFGTPPVVLSLEEAALGDRSYGPDDIVVCLVDYGSSSPFLADINEARWHSLQDLVRSCRRILWVSSGGGQSPHPDQGILSGLARTLRLEHYELQLVTLALEPPAILDEARNTKAVRHLTQVTREMALTGLRENYEQEYTEIAGRLHIHRLVEADRTTETLQQKLAGTQVVSRPVGEVRFDTTPTDDTPEGIRYAESSAVDEQEDISADAVEIAVRAASLQSLERAAALGWDGVTEKQPPAPAFCDYYTGTVLRAGASSGFGPGDHVLATSRGPFRSHVQLSSECVASLALEVPFSAACASASPATTAYNALVEIGRVRPSDSVLVHDISSPIGKAAARLLARVGVKEIWATAADEDDCRAAVEQLGYKRNHVLPKSWFDSPSLLASRWKQAFDIVLMPYANADSLPLAMSCVRPGGHYIVMRTGIPRLGTAQQMQGVPASVSLSIIQHGSERPSADALRHAAAEAAVEPTCAWTREFSAPELSAAFSLLRTMDEKERIVIQLNESDMVEIRTPKSPESILRPDATYVISGLGGVGRGIARWMVERGARHLLLLSRSSTTKQETRDLLEELGAQGAQVKAPVCDITGQAKLRAVLDQYSESMPPIAGCVQTSMIMTERIFLQMSYEDWRVTVDPKIKGSWNLHTELPTGLDFFILLSSVMGILGSGSLSAYNAGNTYQDALARYRRSCGERATCLDLGAILDVGYLSDALGQGQQVVALGSKMFIRGGLDDVLGLMDMYCNPSAAEGETSTNVDDSQVVVGLRPPGHWKHLEDVPFTMKQPFWGHMHQLILPENEQTSVGDGSSPSGGRKRVDLSEKLAASKSVAEAAEVVSEALATRIGELLGVPPEEGVELQSPMESYGLDSLSAIHVRNWIGSVFDVDMPVFEILGGTTFIDAGTSIGRQVLARRG